MLIILGGVALVLILVIYFNLELSVQDDLKPPTDSNIINEAKPENINLPVRLKIPGIGVNATIESLGLTSDGAMDTPKGADSVGWYALGTRPGEKGSAVITGHYGAWKNGQGSVFDDLHKLNKGDKLSIEDDKGMIIFFVVREIRNYDPNADAVDVFSSDDDQAHLNLITCEGAWNETLKSYPERLIVFTDKE